jgi:hypothetical protein
VDAAEPLLTHGRLGQAADGPCVFEVHAETPAPWPAGARGGYYDAVCVGCDLRWRLAFPVAADDQLAKTAVAYHVATNRGHRVRVTYRPPAPGAQPAEASEPTAPTDDTGARDGPRPEWRGRCGDCGFVAEGQTRTAAAAPLVQHMSRSGHRAWTLLPQRPWPPSGRPETDDPGSGSPSAQD